MRDGVSHQGHTALRKVARPAHLRDCVATARSGLHLRVSAFALRGYGETASPVGTVRMSRDDELTQSKPA